MSAYDPARFVIGASSIEADGPFMATCSGRGEVRVSSMGADELFWAARPGRGGGTRGRGGKEERPAPGGGRCWPRHGF